MQQTEVEGYPLSPGQRRLWRLQTNGSIARVGCTLEIVGGADPDGVERALRSVVDQHEILRTSFPCVPGTRLPLQVIHDDSQVTIQCCENSHNGNGSFDFERLPLVTSKLCQQTASKLSISLSLPAMCADGKSLDNLVAGVAQCYETCQQNSADEPLQYCDFADWHDQLLESPEGRTGKEFWHNRTSSPRRTLPLAAVQINGGCFKPDSVSLELSGSTYESVRDLCQQQSVSPRSFFLSAWAYYLSRLGGEAKQTIGVLVNGRRYAEFEDAIGLYARYVPLSWKQQDTSVQEGVCRVHDQLQQLDKWQDAFCWDPSEASENADAYFPVCFDWVEQSPTFQTGNVAFRIVDRFAHVEPFAWKLCCQPLDAGLKLKWYYDPSLHDAGQISRLLQGFEQLLNGIVADPATRLAELSVIGESERRQLLVDWNQSERSYDTPRLVHELFEQQVQASPHQPAVAFEGQSLTYDELNRRSNQLAHLLQSRGVGPDVLVALCVDRSLEMVIGLLGILKAGGAYVPLDPQQPTERLEGMLHDAQPQLLLTQEHLLAGVLLRARDGDVHGVQLRPADTILLDQDPAPWAEQSEENPASGVQDSNLVYVIFTSGSTGRPKGVQLEHRQLVNYTRAVIERLDLPTAANYATVSTVAADLGNTMIFGALCNGGCLHVISQQRGFESIALSEYMQNEAIDCLKIVPSHLNALLKSGDVERLLPRKRLILGGEAFDKDLYAELCSIEGGPRLFNHYGPTETTIGVLATEAEVNVARSCTPCSEDSEYNSELQTAVATVPLGQPLANTQAYVLDRFGQPTPTGVPGELYIGGATVCRGYMGHAKLTAQRFVPDPFGATPGSRLYRTGDLVRWLPVAQSEMGVLEFLGRIDHQVKIHGYRIELGEIEAALLDHPQLTGAVVTVHADESKESRLAAYFSSTAELSADQLRTYLRQKLPDYMLPSWLVPLKSLPLSANGKLDRQALPSPEEAVATASRQYVAPRNELEQSLAAIWQEVLSVERVGIHDSFFELGGHSLLAMQLLSRIRQIAGCELPVRELFEKPTIAGLSEVMEKLVTAPTGPSIQRVSREGPLALSFAQQRLWFLDQLSPGNAAYNVPVALRVQGPLNLEVLERCIQEIFQRHESMRTTFGETDGVPYQQIAPALSFELPLVDLTHLPSAERDAEAHRLAREESQKGFNLQQGPLVRAQVLRLGGDDHVVLWTLHHIISDGWSSAIVIRELGVLYDAFQQGSESPLDELTIQYADFADWQRQYLQGELFENQLEYWKRQLVATPKLSLPTDKARPKQITFNGARHTLSLDKLMLDNLHETARRNETTAFITLLAALKAFLARYTGMTDVAVGSPVAGRTRSEVESLVGFFVNTLVLRTQLGGDPNFDEVLNRVQKVCLDAFANQDVPFEKLLEELQPDRDLGRQPLLQVLFLLQEQSIPAETPDGLQMSVMDVDNQTAKFDMTFIITEMDDTAVLSIEYNSDLFEQATVATLANQFAASLQLIAKDSTCHISELPAIEPEQQQRMLVDWNATESSYEPASFATFFEQQVERTPDATALVYGEEALSYRELNARANQLARLLQSKGIGAESLVGIFVRRSLELTIGVLGTWKCGAAFVPIDPQYPAERIAYMVEDADMQFILTQQDLLYVARDCTPCLNESRDGSECNSELQALCLDSQWGQVAEHSIENLPVQAGPENLAYVIYTSGSTGKPKGAELSHRGLINVSNEQRRLMHLDSTSRVLQFASFSFDAAVFETVMALGSGATLHLADQDALLPGPELLELLRDQRITHLTIPPSALAAVPVGELPELRTICCAGEACPESLIAQWGSGRQFFNLYGPTETTIWASYFECPEESGRPPIGRPIANTRLYVLDSSLSPVPTGVPGELYIGGMGLARDYHRRPALTAERFVPDPFGGAPGGRLYKTGDSVRWLPDGNLEFLGRIDHQVKIRGIRIELGEIESVLRACHDVREAVVLAREDSNGARRLVAYIVPDRSADALDVQTLRDELLTQLPMYMVPTSFVQLDAIPLTPNGKVDLQVLPQPDGSRPKLGTQYVEPRNETEAAMAKIWQQALGVEQVGVHDDFFALGGHSLLATQLISRMRDHYGIDLPLRDIFAEPTIAGLSALILQARPAAPPITKVSHSDDLPLSFAQQRLWFLNQLVPNNSVYNIPQAVRIQGPLDVDRLQKSISALVDRHESLRTTFHTVEGEARQVIAPDGDCGLTRVDLTDAARSCTPCDRSTDAEYSSVLQSLIEQDAATPFDIEEGPLLRGTVVKCADDDHVLMLTMHHIISDGWSMGIFLQELITLYDSSGDLSSLPPLPIQYADYSVWQRDWMTGAALEQQCGYWREQLDDAHVLQLPADRPRPPIQSHRGQKRLTNLSQKTLERIQQFSHDHDVTVFMTMMAAFQLLLARLSGQNDITVGTPVAGRTRSELEPLIGLFVNTIALRTDLSGNPSFENLVGRVKKVSIDGFAHQEVPFERLVQQLKLARDLGREPLFQAMFAFQNTPISRPSERSDLQLTPLEANSQTSKFDLTLIAAEEAGGLRLIWEYSSDLFDEETIDRFAQSFERLLDFTLARPDVGVAEVPLLEPAERRQVLDGFNDNQHLVEGDRVHKQFEEFVQREVEAVALVFGNTQLSYQQLDQKANRLAHRLRRLGVGAETCVGLCLPRSVQWVVGALGILKAGAAYVSLDPDYPAERLAFMLDDAQVSVIVTDSNCRTELYSVQPEQEAQGVQLRATLCLDDDESLADEPNTAPAVFVHPDQLAYVIYTSGSTGKPKGVAVSHAALENLVAWHRREYDVSVGDRATQLASLGFDASVWELWPYLTAGATLHLADPTYLPSAEDLWNWLGESSIDLCFLPTPLAEQALQAIPSKDLPLRALLTGGDQLRSRPPADCPFRLINHYGPTENAVVATAGDVASADSHATLPHIGHGISNVKVYVLNEQLEPAPVGTAGELYIGGTSLARGYLQNPSMTAERFVPNPFSDVPGSRLYRTGDLCRWLPDGHLDFVGRLDHQVNVRGFRIELGEIENVLRQHVAVRDCVVIVREDTPTMKRLVAYLVPTQSAPVLHTTEIEQTLSEQLPAHMIPADFVTLDELPRTAHGKIDRRALPRPDAVDLPLSDQYTPPRDDKEQALVDIWQQILGVKRVGVHDNFFDLGGDSILCIRAVAQASSAGLRISPQQMFQHQTIAELAAVAERGVAVNAEQGLVTGPVLLTPIQRWFFEQSLANPHHFNQAVMLEIRFRTDVDLLRSAWQRIVEHHDILRSRFSESDDGWRLQLEQPNSDAIDSVFCEVDLSHIAGELQTAAVEEHAEQMQRSLHLQDGPLVRMGLIRLSPGNERLLIVAHHSVIDGVSWRILLEDLMAAYEQLASGLAVTLPAKTTSYRQWSERLAGFAHSDEMTSEMEYWQKVASDSAPELPTDLREGPNDAASVQTVSGELTEEETEALLREVPAAYHSQINDVLLTALARTLAGWTGHSQALVALEGHGREDLFDDIDVSRTVGWFTSLFPVQLQLPTDDSIGDSLMSVKEQLRKVPQRGLGYGVSRYLRDDVELVSKLASVTPQVSFNYLGQFDRMIPQGAPLGPAPEFAGSRQSADNMRSYLIDISGGVQSGRLTMHWTYSKNRHFAATIQQLSDTYFVQLRAIIQHCQSPEAGGFTPSDVAEFFDDWDQDDLRAVDDAIRRSLDGGEFSNETTT